MRFSMVAALLIAIGAAGMGWRNRERLGGLRADYGKLVSEAERLGLDRPSEVAGQVGSLPVRSAEREAALRPMTVKERADKMLSFAKGIADLKGRMDENNMGPMVEMMEVASSVDPADLPELLRLVDDGLKAMDLPDMNAETRSGMMMFILVAASSKNPKAALETAMVSVTLLGGPEKHAELVPSLLGSWAKRDPNAAAAWLLHNGGTLPGEMKLYMTRTLAQVVALTDPESAFRMVREAGLQREGDLARVLVSCAETPAQKIRSLSLCRQYFVLDETGRPSAELMAKLGGYFGEIAAQDGYEAGSRWLESAGFSPEEMKDGVFKAVSDQLRLVEVGRWIEWMGRQGTAEDSRPSVRRLMERWTKSDFIAAGQWLAGAPEVPSKQEAVRTFAETVAKYDPEAASEWALTLPAGQERDVTLRKILNDWPKEFPEDEEAAEKFARANGLK